MTDADNSPSPSTVVNPSGISSSNNGGGGGSGSGGLGSRLGIRRRGGSANSASSSSSSNSSSLGTSASQQVVPSGKLLIHSQTSTHQYMVRSPSTNSGTGSINSHSWPKVAAPPVSFAEFRKYDANPRKQRAALSSLQRQDARLRTLAKAAAASTVASYFQRKPYKEPKFKEEKSRKGFVKLTGLLHKKKKKRSRCEIFHLLYLAIVDQRSNLACTYLEDISSAALRRKQPALANKVFLSALSKALESVCIVMLDKGFPISVNSPVSLNRIELLPSSPTKDKPSHAGHVRVPSSSKGIETASSSHAFELPSSFMIAVGFGLENVTRNMIKRADVNQTWHGMTPLLIAASKNWVGLIQLLLEHGADPNIPILLAQYALLRRFKTCSPGPPPSAISALSPRTSSPSDVVSLSCHSAPPIIQAIFPSMSPGVNNATSSLDASVLPKSNGDSGNTDGEGDGYSSAVSADEFNISRSPSNNPATPTLSVPTETTAIGNNSPSSPSINPSQITSASGLGAKGLRSTGYPYLMQALGSPAAPVSLGVASDKKSEFAGWPLDRSHEMKIYPVELAAACGHIDVVRCLLPKMDQKILAQTSFALIVQRDVDMTNLFLRNGVPISQKDAYGSTALHLACRSGDVELVECLLNAKADVNSRGQNDWSPLHEALSQRRIDVAKCLIRNGADVNALNNAGETPRDVGLRMHLLQQDLDVIFSTSSDSSRHSFTGSETNFNLTSVSSGKPVLKHSSSLKNAADVFASGSEPPRLARSLTNPDKGKKSSFKSRFLKKQ